MEGGLFTANARAKDNGVRLFPCVSGQKEKTVGSNPFLQKSNTFLCNRSEGDRFADTKLAVYSEGVWWRKMM